MSKSITNSIPVVCRHIKYLSNAVNNILNQTLKPNEIIIIISEYKDNENNSNILKDIEEIVAKNNINLIIKVFNDIQYAGKNREIAYNLCSSDIIIYQDCDDNTHCKRNEVLMHFHNKSNSPHILHGWRFDIDPTSNINIESLNYTTYDESIKLKRPPHNGVPFLAKYIIKGFKFPNQKNGQDVELNKMLKEKYNSICVLTSDLYQYNAYQSSWYNPEDKNEILRMDNFYKEANKEITEANKRNL